MGVKISRREGGFFWGGNCGDGFSFGGGEEGNRGWRSVSVVLVDFIRRG